MLLDLAEMPPAGKLVLAVLAAALVASVVTDLRTRKILNVVTLPAALAVLGVHLAAGGWPGLRAGLIGLAVCAGPMLIVALPGWMGMGDVKLMAVVGAALGWPLCLAALLWVTVAGGAQAVLWLVGARVLGRERPRYVPYAVAICAGTIAAFSLGLPLV